MNTTKFLTFALNQLGAPYVWGAKGSLLWTLDGMKPLTPGLKGKLAYDCSGLVTCALREAGGPDVRASHNAQALADNMTHLLNYGVAAPGDLMFFGRGPLHISHVAIVVAPGLVVEAAGGDHTCTSFEIAKERGARVRIGPVRRDDFVVACGWEAFNEAK